MCVDTSVSSSVKKYIRLKTNCRW